VQTADGFPVSHEVFEGNVGEVTTVQGMVKSLLERFPIRRLVLVADRGMLSMDTLDVIDGLKLPNGRPVEYILAVPARRCREMTKDLAVLHRGLVEEARRTGGQAVAESEVDGRRLVVAHDAELARQMRLRRARALAEAARLANGLAGRLIDQQEGKPRRGRKLTDNGARLKLRDYLVDHHLTRIIRIDWEDEVFSWDYDVEELKRELMLDGKLVLVSTVKELAAADVVARYKGLADIERSFRVAKSTLELAPVYHRLPERIRAHTMICFLALVIHRVMQARLKRASLDLSPERVLYMLKGVQKHRAQLASAKVLEGVTTLKAEQRLLFEALEVNPPTLKEVTAAA
jgi:transposase